MILIRKIKTAINLIKKYFSTLHITKNLIKGSVPLYNLKLVEKSDLMVLVPHADDEWIGCSSLLQKYSDYTFLVNVDMSGDGEPIEIHNERYKELMNVIVKYNLKHFTLKGDYNIKIEQLSKLLLEKKPNYIAVPCYVDWHEEHIETMHILKNALEMIKSKWGGVAHILMYQVSVPIPEDLITHYMGMSKKDYKFKWKYFDKVYKTQRQIAWYRYRCNERINGALCNMFAAEVFSVAKSLDWVENLDNMILSEEKRLLIKKNLGDLQYVRELVGNKKRI
ncbi:MAG: hypothetical protein HFE31_04005 [Clostridia bacterium]|nr:hypothetical protein [Clostridia bacterium]